MTYRQEFPDFDAATLPAIPAHWVDRSWRNDACPCWWAVEEGNEGVAVYIDHADPARREHADLPRFSVVQYKDRDTLSILDSDDWQAVLVAVAEVTECP